MASSLRRSAQALSERIGPDASYPFVPPSLGEDEASASRRRVPILRVLWLASLALFVVVVVLAVLVALGV